jgi:anti-sigma factor RsiW
MKHRPDSAELNAYVDGELPPDRAARVARAVAEDRQLAREVAALLRLKTATMAAFDSEPPALPRASRRPSIRGGAAWAGAAFAVLAMLAVAAGSFLIVTPPRPGAESVAALLEAWNRDQVSPGSSSFASPVGGTPDTAGVVRLMQGLADLRLRVVRSQPVAQGMAFDLIGPSGCRLAVWAGPSSLPLVAAPALAARLEAGDAVAWQAGGTQFLLVSYNAPRQKFAVMAAALQRAILDAAPADDSALSRVAEARSQGLPCKA